MSDQAESTAITEEQALAFRARRHHLLGPGAPDVRAAARAVVGIQAQVVAPALWSLAVRTAGRPTAAELADALETSPGLVRTWGQRDTVHIYDAEAHWAAIVTALESWPIGARGGRQPDREAIDAAGTRIEQLDRPVTRSDLFDLVPEEFLEWMTERTGPGTPALRGAAGRFVWDLARRGELSAHTVVDGEQSYILRTRRFPDLDWDPPDQERAGALLARDYLSANAPATVHDVAHFFGMRIGDARSILDTLADELAPVECGGRDDLLALRADLDDLGSTPPGDWPPRLLPKFDTMLMCHRDKSWTVPDEDERGRIWAKAAQVRATVLHRGRLVATWTHRALKGSVRVEIAPLSGWLSGLEDALADEAAAFARHLGVEGATVRVA